MGDLIMIKRGTPRPPKAAVQYELDIINNADHFSTYQHGYRESWKAEGIKSLEEAMNVARDWLTKAGDNPRPVMIYAVKGGHQALVGNLHRNGRWVEAVRR